MTVENTDNQQIDETAGFVTTSSDLPEVQPESQEPQQQEEPASSEGADTEVSEKETDKTIDAGEDTTADTEKAKKSNGVQKRIDKVTRQREEERRKNEALERENAELRAKLESPNDGKESKPPVESDYDTYDKYLDALDAYENKTPEKKSEKQPEQQSDEVQTELTDSQKTAMAILREKVDSSDKPDNFEEVALNPDVDITAEMVEALAECDNPANVMMHLGNNKDLATEIAGQSPAQQMRAIAKIDLTVTSKPPKPTKTTKAPEPISPVSGSDAQQKDVSEMSFAEYEAHMNEKEQKRRSSW
jgi:hypothetical protein